MFAILSFLGSFSPVKSPQKRSSGKFHAVTFNQAGCQMDLNNIQGGLISL